MSAPTAPTASCARVRPVVERGRRSGHWVRARMRGRRGTLLRVGRGKGQDFEMWRRSGRENRRGRTGARMLPRARRRPCTWASRWASCSIEGGEEWSGTLCDWREEWELEDGSAGRIGPMGRSRVENTMLTITLKYESTLLGRGWQRRGGNERSEGEEERRSPVASKARQLQDEYYVTDYITI
jgi:hypothetical protein